MSHNVRQVKESPIYQGEDETVVYTLTVPATWGSSPASPTAVMKDKDGADVSTTNLSGSASVSDAVITTPSVTALTIGEEYRLEIKWTDSGNTFEAFCIFYGQE